jgi:glyoxylase-like metal-dependent hydrolase (beta-lactamase superfamily II)
MNMFDRDIAPGIHRVADGYVNWYLLEDDTGVTVVDAGLPPHWKVLLRTLSDLGRTRDDVRALVLTHAHYDHVGFARRLQKEWGVPVFVHQRDQKLARHPALFRSERLPLAYFKHPPFLKVFAHFAARRAFLAPPVTDTRPLPAHGSVLDVPGKPVVIECPGHTHGHVGLHIPSADAMLVGDAIVTLDPYTVTTGPRLVAKAATADSELALRSLDAIAATGATMLLPGHGDPWRGGAQEAVRLARAAGTR